MHTQSTTSPRAPPKLHPPPPAPFLLTPQGDEIHLIHVIPPAQRIVMAPSDIGTIGGIIEEDEATKKKVVRWGATVSFKGIANENHHVWFDQITTHFLKQQQLPCAGISCGYRLSRKHLQQLHFFKALAHVYVHSHVCSENICWGALWPCPPTQCGNGRWFSPPLPISCDRRPPPDNLHAFPPDPLCWQEEHALNFIHDRFQKTLEEKKVRSL